MYSSISVTRNKTGAFSVISPSSVIRCIWTCIRKGFPPYWRERKPWQWYSVWEKNGIQWQIIAAYFNSFKSMNFQLMEVGFYWSNSGEGRGGGNCATKPTVGFSIHMSVTCNTLSMLSPENITEKCMETWKCIHSLSRLATLLSLAQ